MSVTHDVNPTVTEQNIDKVSHQLLKYAAHLLQQGATQQVVTESFFRTALTIAIADLGVSTTIENLELAAFVMRGDGAAPPSAARAH